MRWLAASGKKGIQGEKQVARRLRRLDSRQYIVLSDLLLPCGSRLTQIDHVVVSVYGIFVIETKNYHGTISGSIWKEFWVQECHGRQYDLRNPFRQNYAHVQALASLLGLERDCLAFADDAVLQVVQPEDSTEQLVPISKVCRAVRRRKQPLLLWDDVRYYAGVILCANIEDSQAREQHLSQIDDEIAYRRFALARFMAVPTIRNAAIRWKMKCSEKVKLCKLVIIFMKIKCEKTLAFPNQMCYTTEVHEYRMHAIKGNTAQSL